MVGQWGHLQHVRQGRTGHLRTLHIFQTRSSRIWRASGPYRLKKSACDSRNRCARSRRVRSRSVKGQMAEQVEWVSLRLLRHLGQLIEADASLGQPANYLRSLRRVRPLCLQLWRGGTQGADRFRRVVLVADHPQLRAVRVDVVNEVGDDFDLPPIEVELTGWPCLQTRWSPDRFRPRGPPPPAAAFP